MKKVIGYSDLFDGVAKSKVVTYTTKSSKLRVVLRENGKLASVLEARGTGVDMIKMVSRLIKDYKRVTSISDQVHNRHEAAIMFKAGLRFQYDKDSIVKTITDTMQVLAGNGSIRMVWERP